ncbi:facilitated trehalose transporter Tret1-like [Belonocnema kinseyi]|uniref:facilitated trehalose transporter Tret1-like n=1 Tax=Belonocnema kinseyi TaxID=2817044 RepID=UPI00143D3C38|nr:facilitated trehalose transporter Tret1-like [Belonocnema kinseyi]
MPRKRDSEFRQYVAAIIGCLTSIGYGTALTWTSPAIPYLRSINSTLPVTTEQSDRISSLITIGYIIGYILNPFIIEKLGRKRTLMLYSIPQIISWVLIIIAKNHTTIYIARLLGGIGYGGAICALTIYLSEVGSPKIRGIFIVFMNLSMGLGFFLVMFLGAFVSYYCMNLVLLSIPAIFVATFSFVPDSPHFMEKIYREGIEMKLKLNPLLLENGEKEKEEFEKEESEKEEHEKGEYDKEEHEEEEHEKGELETTKFFIFKKSMIWKLLSLSHNRKALFIVISIAAMDSFSGHMILWTFTQQLLTYKGSLIDPEKATLILTVVKFTASIISTQIIEKMGRRVLLLSSGIIGTIAHALVGVFFYFEERNFELSFFSWVPLVGMATFEFAFAAGSANLFYLYQAELFSTDVKSMAVMVIKVSYMIFSYFCLFRFQVLLVDIGRCTIFWIFSVFAGIGTFFVFSMTPETRGKTIDEIQVILKSKKFFV